MIFGSGARHTLRSALHGPMPLCPQPACFLHACPRANGSAPSRPSAAPPHPTPQGLVFVSNHSAGALAGYSWGRGVLIARLRDGWSAPLFLRQGSGSLGLLLGWQHEEACHVLQVCGRRTGRQGGECGRNSGAVHPGMLHGSERVLPCLATCTSPCFVHTCAHPVLSIPLLQSVEQVQAFASQHAHEMEVGAESADPDTAQPLRWALVCGRGCRSCTAGWRGGALRGGLWGAPSLGLAGWRPGAPGSNCVSAGIALCAHGR